MTKAYFTIVVLEKRGYNIKSNHKIKGVLFMDLILALAAAQGAEITEEAQQLLFVLLGGGLLVIVFAIVVSVLATVVSTIAATQTGDEE